MDKCNNTDDFLTVRTGKQLHGERVIQGRRVL